MKETIMKIRNAYLSNTLDTIENNDDVKYVNDKFPKLYNMVCSNSCDDEMLHHMLSVYNNVQQGTISKEKGDEAFGESAASKYVYPLINKK